YRRGRMLDGDSGTTYGPGGLDIPGDGVDSPAALSRRPPGRGGGGGFPLRGIGPGAGARQLAEPQLHEPAGAAGAVLHRLPDRPGGGGCRRHFGGPGLGLRRGPGGPQPGAYPLEPGVAALRGVRHRRAATAGVLGPALCQAFGLTAQRSQAAMHTAITITSKNQRSTFWGTEMANFTDSLTPIMQPTASTSPGIHSTWPRATNTTSATAAKIAVAAILRALARTRS